MSCPHVCLAWHASSENFYVLYRGKTPDATSAENFAPGLQVRMLYVKEGYTTAHGTRVRHMRHARLEAGRVRQKVAFAGAAAAAR